MSRTDVVIDQKSPSPDGSKLLIRYRFDSGALGYTSERDVIVPVKNLRDDLQPFRLPDKYEPIRWEKDGSLTVAVDYVECIRKNEDCSKTRDNFRGTLINLRIDDTTDGKAQEIEADLPSPDGHQRLVAYRYPSGDRSNLSQNHISIIRRDAEIPRYGNYYIASVEGDGILGVLSVNVICFVVLLPLFAFREVSRIVGRREMWCVFPTRRERPQAGVAGAAISPSPRLVAGRYREEQEGHGTYIWYGGNYQNVSVAWQYSWLWRPN